jgi:hypothetical protein
MKMPGTSAGTDVALTSFSATPNLMAEHFQGCQGKNGKEGEMAVLTELSKCQPDVAKEAP